MKFAIGEFLRELDEPLKFSLKSENFIIPFAWGLTCTSVHISTLSLFAIVETKTLKCVVYSEIHFVFWTTPHVLKYILCSEVHLMFWNTFCVLKYTLCSEIHFVFWTTPYVLKLMPCSELHLMFLNTLYILKWLLYSQKHCILTHLLCPEIKFMFWNTFMFYNAQYVLKFLECSRILNYLNQIYPTYHRI